MLKEVLKNIHNNKSDVQNNNENTAKIIKKNNIKNIKQKITIFLSVLFISFLTIMLLFIGILNKNVSIENKIDTISFKEHNITTISNNAIMNYFFNKNEKLRIYSKKTKTFDKNINVMEENRIITPHIRKKIYTGNTKLIQIDGKRDDFLIPNEMYLTNKDVNYIYTKELQGNFYNAIASKKPFKINDDDIFLSGDDLYFVPNNNYLKITKNSHLIQTKINKKNKQKTYDIKSQQMEYFGEKSIAYFIKNVFYNDGDNFVKCQFSKVYLDENNKIRDVFLKDKVKITQKTSNAIANYGFFDKNNNLVLLYKNVVLKSKEDVSKTDIYIYNTEDKSSISINEYTPLTKKEKQQFYGILMKLANELEKKEKKAIKNFIETNKKAKIEAISSSDNKNVNRKKRAKVKITKS